MSLPPEPDPKLAAAYRRARYEIDCGGMPVLRRIGLIDDAADARMALAGCQSGWHILTPCNPGSRRLSAAANRKRLAGLKAELRTAGWRSLPARNSDASGDWIEPGLCILDRDTRAVTELARHYGQRAVVGAQLGEAPRLIWLA